MLDETYRARVFFYTSIGSPRSFIYTLSVLFTLFTDRLKLHSHKGELFPCRFLDVTVLLHPLGLSVGGFAGAEGIG